MENNLKLLKAIPIFSGIKDEALRLLASLLKDERVQKDNRIIREGDHSNMMYIIHSGSAEVRKVINREACKYKTLAILEQGDIFGEMGVFGGEYRSADVVAREDTVLWRMDYNDFFKVIEANAADGVKLLRVIITILIERVRALNTELAALYEIGRLFQQVMNDITPAKMGFIALWNQFNDEFDIYNSSNIGAACSVEKTNPLSERIFENKSPFLIKDIAEHPGFEGRYYSARSFIVSPFVHENEVLGFIFLGSPETKNAFTYNHLILLSAVCGQIAVRLKEIERKTEDAYKKRLADARL
ncbi:MAG: cyclic nucleotide-binding domain-containing protein [Nitrospirae bacterium]|nr:cyclic nucleotide-binding domain-containing protein [Nitrospirota bacterium]